MHVSKENPKESLLRPAILILTTLVSAAMLAAVGFGVGWFLSGRQLASAGGGVGPPPATTSPEHEATLPTSDVTGEDLPGLPRYPGSVRVDYQQEVIKGGFNLTKTTYEAAAKVGEVKDFYRGVFQSGDWTVADLDFSAGTWSFMVVEDRRQAYLEIAPQGENLVEVAIRLSEPHSDQGSQEEDTDSTKPGDAPSGEQESPSTSAPATPAPSYNSPAPSYSAPAPSYPAPDGGLEDDYREDYDDDYREDYDDDYREDYDGD
jgi:hypothetical protein